MSAVALQCNQFKRKVGELMNVLFYALLLFLFEDIVFLTYKLTYLKIYKKRLTSLFISVKSKIHQSVNIEGRCELRTLRKDCADKTLDIKYVKLSKYFLKHLNELLDNLEIGKTYTTTTHVKTQFVRAEKRERIKMIINENSKKRKFFKETIPFLGLKDFLKIYFSKDKTEKDRLYKEFYEITFTRTK